MARLKPQAKLLISLAVRLFDVWRASLARVLGREHPPACVVLYYHGVPIEKRGLFGCQLDTLLRFAEPVAIDPVPALCRGKFYAAVTFDDGYVSVLENAVPELMKRKIPWTVFVPSGCLGQRPSWLRNPSKTVNEEWVMTAEQLRTLAKNPQVTIGSHTVTHAHLIEVGPQRAAVELFQSKNDLEQVLGKPVTLFSYPFGARTPALDEQARAVGYQRVFSSSPRLAFRESNEFVVGRVQSDPGIKLLEFQLKILGAYRWLATCRT